MQRFLDFEDRFLSLVTGKHGWLASHFTELFHSKWPYVVILAVTLLTLLAFFDLGLKRRAVLWRVLMNFVTVAFPIAMLLMQVALLTVGRADDTWWCDPSQLGGRKTLLHIGLFLLFLVAQWGATLVYFLCVHHDTVDHDEDGMSITFFPLFLSLVLFYPVGSWLIYHLGTWIHLPGIVGIVLWVAIPVVGLLSTWFLNIGFGFVRGTLFTLFALCVAVGLLAGLCCLIDVCDIMYHHYIVQFWFFIILFGICFALVAYNEKDGGKLSDGTNIIFYWYENPGCSGVIVAAIAAYLIGHYFFHWF